MKNKKIVKDTSSDIAMLGVAVADALASAWGEDDPEIDRVVRTVVIHDELIRTVKAYRLLCGEFGLKNQWPYIDRLLTKADGAK